MENFKKGGLDKQTAQRVLDVWKETGASDDQGLKKLFLKRCVGPGCNSTVACATAVSAAAARPAVGCRSCRLAAERMDVADDARA